MKITRPYHPLEHHELEALNEAKQSLLVTHPDGHGGLGFVGQYPNAFATFVFAVSGQFG